MTTSVFKLVPAVDDFRFLATDDEFTWWPGPHPLKFDGTPRDAWQNQPFRLHLKRKPVPDLWAMAEILGAFAVKPDVASLLSDEFDRAKAELVPNVSEAGEFLLVNVGRVLDCLDMTRATIQMGIVRSYDFDPARLPNAGLFKIPQTASIETLTVERDGNGFAATVESLGLKGMRFEELWNSDEGARPQPLGALRL